MISDQVRNPAHALNPQQAGFGTSNTCGTGHKTKCTWHPPRPSRCTSQFLIHADKAAPTKKLPKHTRIVNAPTTAPSSARSPTAAGLPSQWSVSATRCMLSTATDLPSKHLSQGADSLLEVLQGRCCLLHSRLLSQPGQTTCSEPSTNVHFGFDTARGGCGGQLSCGTRDHATISVHAASQVHVVTWRCHTAHSKKGVQYAAAFYHRKRQPHAYSKVMLPLPIRLPPCATAWLAARANSGGRSTSA